MCANSLAIYKVTITQVRTESTIKGKEWVQGAAQTPDEPNKWGYTPQVIEIKDVTREIYSQSVEDLDIEAVVRAVNKIGVSA